MKLTKCKISKLYNKKNQTRKRYKKIQSVKVKTFRQNHQMNLEKKTLKRFYNIDTRDDNKN